MLEFIESRDDVIAGRVSEGDYQERNASGVAVPQ